MDEQSYIAGSRAAWGVILRQALKELDAEERTEHQWLLEREAAIAALREICSKHGDNDWDESLHIADVIEKHLGRHLPDSTG